MHPRYGDVMIRSLIGATATSFIVTDALTLKFISGPFPSMEAAMADANVVATSQRGAVWQENQDELGREVGPPIRVAFGREQTHA